MKKVKVIAILFVAFMACGDDEPEWSRFVQRGGYDTPNVGSDTSVEIYQDSTTSPPSDDTSHVPIPDAVDTYQQPTQGIPQGRLAVQCPQDVNIVYWGQPGERMLTYNAKAGELAWDQLGGARALTLIPRVECTCYLWPYSLGVTHDLTGSGYGCQI